MSWAEIKNALNSTVGTEEFQSLDEMIETVYGMFYGKMLITENKTFTVPKGVTKLFISGCGAGGNGGGRSVNTGGNAGQYVIQEEVSVNPGDVFTITVGTGNTVISSTGGYSKTLAANSIQTEHHINLIGWETGYNGYAGEGSGKGGYGGAFGFGGGGGGDGYNTTAYDNEPGGGGSPSGEHRGSASLTAGGTGGYGGGNYTAGSGGDAGGYGAGGGGAGYGTRGGTGGSGSQGSWVLSGSTELSGICRVQLLLWNLFVL